MPNRPAWHVAGCAPVEGGAWAPLGAGARGGAWAQVGSKAPGRGGRGLAALQGCALCIGLFLAGTAAVAWLRDWSPGALLLGRPSGEAAQRGPAAGRAVPVPGGVIEPPVYANQSISACSFASNGWQAGFPAHRLWTDYAQLHRATRERLTAGQANYGKILLWHCFDDEPCNGFADQLKGISSALYFGMLTDRAVFINKWSRHGQDLTPLFGRPNIDWLLPASFHDTCDSFCMMEDNAGSLISRISDLAHSTFDRPCVSFNSNSIASAFVNHIARKGSDLSSRATAIMSIVKPEYMVGCAVNYMFSFLDAFNALQVHTRLELPQGALRVPHGYVAVHLRFGDRVFQGLDTASGSMVVEALQCAGRLGQELFGSAEDWGIFFSSDSIAARQTALALGTMDGKLVFATYASPVHIGGTGTGMLWKALAWLHSDIGQDGHQLLWSTLGDHLLLSRARGLVQCWDQQRQCGRVNTANGAFSLSGFSVTAAQEEFLPSSNFRLASAGQCLRHDLPDE